MKLSRTELLRMARCGAADGHDDEWHAAMTTNKFLLAEMRDAADAQRAELKAIEDALDMRAKR